MSDNKIMHHQEAGRRSVSLEDFNIEMNEKNKAYAFILHHRLFDAFRSFCREHAKEKDFLDLCLKSLADKVES